MPAVGETLDLLSKLDASNSNSSLLQQQGLSLKARESASLSLKRIFDQIKTGHKLPTPCNKSQEPPLRHNVSVDMQLASSGIYEPINEVSAHERSRAMDDKVKVGVSFELSSFSYDNGEPVVLDQIKRPLPHHHDEGMEKTSTINHDLKSPTRSAQLTIFYSDTVYVYEDVPADKAQAIMFLAAGIGGGDDQSEALTVAQPKHVMAFSANAFSKMRPDTPPSSRSSFIAFSAHSTRKRLINRSQAELPFARKASLARFLEGRKERVKAKAVNEMLERPSSPPKKRLCIGHVDQPRPSTTRMASCTRS